MRFIKADKHFFLCASQFVIGCVHIIVVGAEVFFFVVVVVAF